MWKDFMFNNSKVKKGFSLPEVMVGMTILVLVIFASTNLIVTIIRNNTANINTMIAHGLAQEGLEAVRNMRDSNWLLNADFEGKVRNTSIWGDALPAVGNEQYYAVNLKNFDTVTNRDLIRNEDLLVNYTPWSLSLLGSTEPDTDDEIRIMKEEDIAGSGRVIFKHADFAVSDNSETNFYRYLKINRSEEDRMHVQSVVKWTENGRDRNVTLTTILTNWNQGQL
ncbi:prepilin-type N-terminal cleavage/methylation domain-containing protein [Candidatus Peregrinibacteria bacterium]|nr:prepilin-type N-terminal cleavage/methylation domain-containing protein [Candidatus Peregrinibacteria bacterium]